MKKFWYISILNLKNHEEEIEKLKEQFNKLTIIDFKEVGKTRLTPKVDDHKYAYHIIIEFLGTQENIVEIEKYSKNNNNILKFIIVNII